jgi:hypothetical protein
MRDNRDVLYQVPKDLAYRYLKRYISPETVKLAVYKSCIDNYVMRKTFWNVMPLLCDTGMLAIQCSFHNISRVVDLIEKENYDYDVLYFHGPNVKGLSLHNYYDASVVFVIVYKNGNLNRLQQQSNIIQIDADVPIDEISFKLLLLTHPLDLIIYIGDAMVMARVAKTIGRNIIVFGDDDIFKQNLLDEGVREIEVKL